MYPLGYTQDTSRYIRIRILITNPPKLDNKPPLTPLGSRPRGAVGSGPVAVESVAASVVAPDVRDVC